MSIYSDIEVEYIDGYGSDLLIVNAARVSFHKKSDYISNFTAVKSSDKEKRHKLYPKWEDYLDYTWKTHEVKSKLLSFNDFRLIHFLARKHHWSPFGHGSFTFRIKAPMNPIANQLKKHQVGLVWNEVSRRYYDGPVELFKMDFKKAGEDKRSEGTGFIDRHPDLDAHEAKSIEMYNEMVALGGAAEDIRTLLPQNMMTEWYWSGSVAAFMRVVALRTHADTQRQTRIVANKIADILKEKVPVSYLAHFGNEL